MQKTRKGFTLVELVVVIAVIAILAGVLIGTFASVINKANASAKAQEIKQQEIEQKATDILKKLEESNWLGWEDFEANLVAKLTEVYEKTPTASITSDDVKKAVNDAFTTYMAAHQTGTTQLTEKQVKAIIENALGTIDFSGVTETQVKAIINAATTAIPTSSQIKAIVEAANAKNLTANDVAKIVAENHDKTITEIQTAITSATANLATSEQAEEILNYLSSADSSSVILAKALNINISQKGITTASSPYEVVSALGGDGTVNDLPKTVLLDLVNGAPAFFVVDSAKKVVYDGGKADLPDTLTNTYKYWTFADTVSDTYSTYLTAVPTTVAPNGVGLDVGNQTIASVNYTDTVSDADAAESRSVVIRTNGGSLTINAKNDNVTHYGEASNVNVIAVKSSSYHEYGTVAIIQVASGRIELEATAEVDGIHINAKVVSIDEEGNVTYSTSEFANDITLTIGGKEVSLTRDSVGDANIGGSDKLLVCKVETSDKSEYVWLDGDGTIENSNVYVSSNANGSDAVAVNLSNASDAAKAIANNAVNTGTAEAPVYVPVDTGVTINTSEDKEVWATYDSQAKLEYLINDTTFTNLKQVANITNMTTVEIPQGRVINIDLNGFTIDAALKSTGRHYYAFDNYGELTLQDLSEGKTSYIKARGIENLGGKMTINSGKYYNIDTNGGAAVWNDSDGIKYMLKADVEAAKAKDQNYYDTDLGISISNGYYTVVDSLEGNYAVAGSDWNGNNNNLVRVYYYKNMDGGDLTINGGEFIVEYVGEIKNGGPGVINSQAGTKLTLNGGNINSACQGCYAVIADGETIVNDITVYGAKGAFAVDSGTCIFNGGIFTSNLFYGCWITNDGTDTRVTINGGSFSGKYGIYSSVDDGGQDESNVAITINGGTFEGTSGSAVINTKATQNQFALMIYGGKFSSNPSTYVSSSYTITEDNGWFVVTK